MTLQSRRRCSMLIASSGTVVEWFDYSLFFYLATALSKTFYPHLESSLLLVLATGAVGFLFRPLGAIVFGHIGDTKGRTTSLVISAGFMAVAMGGIAVMPSYQSAGIWGGVGVIIFRALAGFSVGAEYTGIMVYLMESAHPNRRGMTASWAAANSEIGALLAVGSAAVVTATMGSTAFNTWGWRIPFLVGAFLAAAMIPLRKYMVESPVMEQLQKENNKMNPLCYALTYHRLPIVIGFLISTVGSATYFLTITYLPTYIETVQGANTQSALNYGVIAACTAILITPFIGLTSDLLGRRNAFILLLLAVIILVFPGYALLSRDNISFTVIAVVVLAIPAAGWSAVSASAVPEQFNIRGRYSGMAVGYNLATVFFGGLTPPLVAWLIQISGNALAPAYYASVVAVVAGIPAIILMVERK